MTAYVLPEGISLSVEGDGVPVGSLITAPNVARKCKRCRCFECPCCNDWCDSCLRDGDDDPNVKRDGDWWVRFDADGKELHRWNAICAEQLVCEYETESHPLMAKLFEAHRSIFTSKYGGHFGVTNDGRVWFEGKTPQQYEEYLNQQIKTGEKLARQTRLDRNAALANWENHFKSLDAAGKQAHLEGMVHARTLMEWTVQDAEKSGLRTSTREGKKMIAMMQSDIEVMESLK